MAVIGISLGIFFFMIATMGRFAMLLGLKVSWFRKFLISISPVDVRQKYGDSYFFLWQITSILLIISGVGNAVVTEIYSPTGGLEYLLDIGTIFGPPLFLIGFGGYIRKKYWLK